MAGVGGRPGPIGKRDGERVRRNKTGEDGLETKGFDLTEPVEVPKDIVFFDPYVNDLWHALTISVNREFFEPTDWAYAKITLRMLDNVLIKGEVPGAMLLTALDGMMSKLLLTEADRRRLKIEAKRTPATAGEKKVDAETLFRQRFLEQRLPQ